MGTWHEYLPRRSKWLGSKAGEAYHEAGMYMYAEEQRLSEAKRKYWEEKDRKEVEGHH